MSDASSKSQRNNDRKNRNRGNPYAWRSPAERMQEVIDYSRKLFEKCDSEEETVAIRNWLLSELLARGHFVAQEIAPYYVSLREYMLDGRDGELFQIINDDLIGLYTILNDNYKSVAESGVAPGVAVHTLTKMMSQELWKSNSAGAMAIFREMYDLLGMSGKTTAWAEYQRHKELSSGIREAGKLVSLPAPDDVIDEEELDAGTR